MIPLNLYINETITTLPDVVRNNIVSLAFIYAEEALGKYTSQDVAENNDTHYCINCATYIVSAIKHMSKRTSNKLSKPDQNTIIDVLNQYINNKLNKKITEELDGLILRGIRCFSYLDE